MTSRPPRRSHPRAPAPPLPLAAGIAVGLFGLIMGLVVGMFLWGTQIEQLNLEARRLDEELSALREANERLRKEPEGPTRPIRELSIRFLDVPDERLRLELNKRLRALLVDQIVGTAVTDLDPLLAAHIVEGRLFALEEALWRVEIRGSYLIWDTLILYVRVHSEGEAPGEPPPTP